MFLQIAKAPNNHKILPTNWNQDFAIHHEEQKTNMINLQAHLLKQGEQSAHIHYKKSRLFKRPT
jgi:hypothetical protein